MAELGTATLMNKPDSLALLLVYGSLKRGQAHHDQLQGCRWQGQARLQGLALYDLGPFPMAVITANPNHQLVGELYSADAQQLAHLDRFEGVPRLYQRQPFTLPDGRRVWVYVGQPRQVRHVPLIASGVWMGPLRARSSNDSGRH